ncbi:PLC-like phosphodiesterase [Podospora appendiculata]|uniref:PLC-like phosphodiesterase n=1 Tax=Podospora appendiculata TaxID=314037 RepID=A0AAE1CA22_9PEZI|nr:PLC-like phosphodiesterase [Podospora appendiculata]
MATENTSLLAGKLAVSSAASSSGLSQDDGPRLPQTIAHRGYKAAFPENSMGAFRGAVEIGAHAIETDLHLSKDGVVVLSHDASLKRCFGVDKKVAECDWSYLSTLKTLREPQQGIPRLLDLLIYLGKPEQEHIWLLLDIKPDDDADDLLVRTANTIALSPTTRAWSERIVLGAWNANYVDRCRQYFPNFKIAFIGFNLVFARRYLGQPDMDFNLMQPILPGPYGNHFMKAIKKAGQNLYVWTVNEEYWMEWSIRKQVDGVITDDPKLFLEVCDRWAARVESLVKRGGSSRGGRTAVARLYAWAFACQLLSLFVTAIAWRRFTSIDKRKQGLVRV